MIEANLNDKTYCQMDKESVLVQNYNGKLTDSETGYDSSWDSDLGGPVSDENSDMNFRYQLGMLIGVVYANSISKPDHY